MTDIYTQLTNLDKYVTQTKSVVDRQELLNFVSTTPTAEDTAQESKSSTTSQDDSVDTCTITEQLNQSGQSFANVLSGIYDADGNEQEQEAEQTQFLTATDGIFARNGIDYFDQAENGVILYNGVTITCDYANNALCIGDTSAGQDVFVARLSHGKSLIVNRDNMDEISKVMGMFTPQDQKLIANAILTDKQIQHAQYEMDEQESSLYRDNSSNQSN